MSKQDQMTFIGHLDELRERLIRCVFVFAGGFLICYFLINSYVMDFLRQPLFSVLPPGEHKLYFTSLFENFMTHLKIAAVSSIFLFSPFYFYQLWAFIAPGLYPKERRYALPFIVSGTVFFVAGGAFAYYILFPVAFSFFVNFGLETDTPLLTIEAYYTTVLKLLLLFGFAFELPVIVSFLGFLGIIDGAMLREHRKHAIVGIAFLCAMFAPPDAISMVILMVPLLLMYEGAIVVVSWFGASRRSREEEETGVANRESRR